VTLLGVELDWLTEDAGGAVQRRAVKPAGRDAMAMLLLQAKHAHDLRGLSVVVVLPVSS